MRGFVKENRLGKVQVRGRRDGPGRTYPKRMLGYKDLTMGEGGL